MKRKNIGFSVLLAATVIATLFLQGAVGAETPPLYHNGVPQFVIGAYSSPGHREVPMEGLQELADAGFNCHWWSMSELKGDRNVTILTGAEVDKAYNNYHMDTIVSCGPYMVDLARYRSVFDAAITEIKNRKGLLMWETWDEPEWWWQQEGRPTLKGLVAAHKFVLARDTNHPVWAVFAAPIVTMAAQSIEGRALTMEVLQQWTGVAPSFAPGVANVFSMDSYPALGHYPNDDLSIIGKNIDLMKMATNEAKPVIAVLQGCPRGPAVPKLIETRFMVYDSIIHGAKGVVWWGSYMLQSTDRMWGSVFVPAGDQVWNDMKVVAGELRDLQDIWVSNATTAGVTLDDSNLESIQKVVNGNRYLIVANKSSFTLTNKSITVTGWNYARNGNKVPVLFENNRNIATTSTTWFDSFAPWGVHVYTDKLIKL